MHCNDHLGNKSRIVLREWGLKIVDIPPAHHFLIAPIFKSEEHIEATCSDDTIFNGFQNDLTHRDLSSEIEGRTQNAKKK